MQYGQICRSFALMISKSMFSKSKIHSFNGFGHERVDLPCNFLRLVSRSRKRSAEVCDKIAHRSLRFWNTIWVDMISHNHRVLFLTLLTWPAGSHGRCFFSERYQCDSHSCRRKPWEGLKRQAEASRKTPTHNFMAQLCSTELDKMQKHSNQEDEILLATCGNQTLELCV